MNGQQFKIVGVNTNLPYGNPSNYNNNGFALQPLPLRLVSFTAEVAGEDIRLAWQSEAEVNFSGFEVERSETGAQFLSDRMDEGLGPSRSKPIRFFG
ncbi:MAG: hypothetical protein IPI11_00405 [Haliscomenobacter sp.]|nr:hypothetical protein [Haliscomenobacter sp.]